MGNRAVLNITKFSLGDSTSMAALLLPTMKPNQDVRTYSVVEDLLRENAVQEFCKGVDGVEESAPAARAVFDYVRTIDSGFLNQFSSSGGTIDKNRLYETLLDYNDFSRLYEFYSLLNDWLVAITECATSIYDYSPRRDRASVLKAKIEKSQEFDIRGFGENGILKFYSDGLAALSGHALFDPQCEWRDEDLDAFIGDVQDMEDVLNSGTDVFPGFSQMKTEKRTRENRCQEFWQLVGCLGNGFTEWVVTRDEQDISERVGPPEYDEDLGTWRLNDPGSTEPGQVQPAYSGTTSGAPGAVKLVWKSRITEVEYVATRARRREAEIVQLFELLRLQANGIKLKSYVASSVEYPYFLDLNLNDATQTDEATDADGSTMHTLEREVSLGDNWENNHLKGDRLRIRDMFRIDKLNKVSAYESFILTPGHYGVQKDNEMEQEDVVSRLMQDEMTAYGVVGAANTSSGLYFLTEPDDSSSFSSKSTSFAADSYGVFQTGTFKSFINPLTERDDYLAVSHVSPRIGLLRHFGPKSQAYSSGTDFLSWYNAYVGSVVTKRGEVQGKSSLLKIVAKDSYEWFPSKLGVKYIEGAYGETEYENDEFKQVSHKLPSSGLAIIASIADDNYEQNVPRRFDIEVPCNNNSQYSYLTFGCELVVDPELPIAAKEVSIEFSIDDSAPVRFFLLNNDKKPENISEVNPLYESVKQYDPEVQGRKVINPPKSKIEDNREHVTEFRFIIENNLATEESRVFHISIASTFAALRDLVASENLRKAYANTYVRISNVSIPMQNKADGVTYGDYHAFKASRGGSVDDFWNLSMSIDRASHQHILEVPHNIRMANNSVVSSNYTTASLFSDVLTAKNHMDSEYRMKSVGSNAEFIIDRFRHYTGIDSCSNTISLYYDADVKSKSTFIKDNSDPNLAQEYEVVSEQARAVDDAGDPHIHQLKYKRIETIKAINRFQHDMKHKSNLFSVRVRNSMTNEALAEAQAKYNNSNKDSQAEAELLAAERAVKNVRTLITGVIEKICKDYAPAHNQLFKVYFD